METSPPTYIFVLVRADEGSTQDICVAQGPDLGALATVLTDMYTAAIAACDGPYKAATQDYLAQILQAFLGMLTAHTLVVPGRYELQSVAPIWEKCSLVIVDHCGGFFSAAGP